MRMFGEGRGRRGYNTRMRRARVRARPQRATERRRGKPGYYVGRRAGRLNAIHAKLAKSEQSEASADLDCAAGGRKERLPSIREIVLSTVSSGRGHADNTPSRCRAVISEERVATLAPTRERQRVRARRVLALTSRRGRDRGRRSVIVCDPPPGKCS